jgi:hypothetical protein
MSTKKGDPTPVIGGCDIPSHLLDSPVQMGNPPDDDLGGQVFWLLSFHPEINLQFRDRDLNGMDDATKQTLRSDIHRVLGVRPLNTSVL